MNIIVCVKQVVDPEAPPASFKVDAEKKTAALPPSIAPVIDPYAEYAVEAALRIKDAQGGKITALSLGSELLRDVVKKPLAMGADELILLEDETFSGGDSWATAYALAMAIRKVGDTDLIFCGRQASDWDAGQVGLGIAEILGLPAVTLAKKVDIADGKARVERVADDGYEVVEVTLPAVITVSNEIGEPRYPTIKGIKCRSFNRQDLKMGISVRFITLRIISRVLVALFSTDVKAISNVNPSFFKISPAKYASLIPLSDKSTSVQPVNIFDLFHSLSPCLIKTIVYVT